MTKDGIETALKTNVAEARGMLDKATAEAKDKYDNCLSDHDIETLEKLVNGVAVATGLRAANNLAPDEALPITVAQRISNLFCVMY